MEVCLNDESKNLLKGAALLENRIKELEERVNKLEQSERSFKDFVVRFVSRYHPEFLSEEGEWIESDYRLQTK